MQQFQAKMKMIQDLKKEINGKFIDCINELNMITNTQQKMKMKRKKIFSNSLHNAINHISLIYTCGGPIKLNKQVEEINGVKVCPEH